MHIESSGKRVGAFVTVHFPMTETNTWCPRYCKGLAREVPGRSIWCKPEASSSWENGLRAGDTVIADGEMFVRGVFSAAKYQCTASVLNFVTTLNFTVDFVFYDLELVFVCI
jgi:hypothetical protein